MHDMVGWLLDLLFPRNCGSCRKPLLHGVLCDDCAATLEFLPDGWIPEQLPGLDGVAAGYPYRGAAANLMKTFKFHQVLDCYRLVLQPQFEAKLCRLLQDVEVDRIAPVPMRRAERWKREFDHADYIARHLAKAAGITYAPTLLRESGQKQSAQHALPHEQRAANVAGVYTASGSASGRSVLVVDDIVTTGSTLCDCARALREAGARQVYATAVLSAILVEDTRNFTQKS